MESTELKQWRESQHLTQKQLADLLGVKENTVYRWEAGKLPISKTVELALKTVGSELKTKEAEKQETAK